MNTFTIMASVAIEHAYRELVPMFESASGVKVQTVWSPSVKMIERLKGGEVVDLVLLSSVAIESLIEAQVLARGSRTDLVTSIVGVAVKQGAARPDTSSADKLKAALLAAPSVGISTGPSGIYMNKLFERLGLTQALQPKLKVYTGTPVGEFVASGEVALGFQQVAELMPVGGIDYWPVSDDVQSVTTFSIGEHLKATNLEAGRKWVQFLISPAAGPVMRKHGVEPVRR
ncbi:MAG TPA: substrate-binding domain-containing protein [Burkholderiales bacterium]|nr:substrate-binding domain-containing protein [Burkholderiales bacterium]